MLALPARERGWPGQKAIAATREGAVCANAPAQSDEINNEVDASRRGRNATDSPLSGAKTNNNHLCAWSPHRDCPLPTFRYLPPSTSKGEIPHSAAGPHPRKGSKHLSRIGHTTIEWNSPRGNFEARRIMGQLEGFH